jgi:sortase (surface protein transpeptidase)
VLVPPTVVVPDPIPPRPRATSGSNIEVVEAYVRLLATPQPGARAVLGVALRNRSAAPSGPIVVGVSADWFDDYSIIGAIPPVLDDRTEDDGYRYFDFPGAAAGTEVSLELHVKAVGAATAAPTVRLMLRDGEQLGEQQAALVVPPPPPGPVRALSVPRLGIKTSVVDTVWEPPAFVAGQIAKTAPLGAGNSVVVGHRTGRAGDVFSRLIGARLGDQIVAVSNGEEHRYIVSAILRRPGSDITPTQPTETPRVTLMTCVGIWNPLTGDYSERLWVVAEPPDLARATLTATVARASHTAETSASWSEATRARGEALIARAALTLMDAEQRRHR